MRVIARAVWELWAGLVGGKGRRELMAGVGNAGRMHGQPEQEGYEQARQNVKKSCVAAVCCSMLWYYQSFLSFFICRLCS